MLMKYFCYGYKFNNRYGPVFNLYEYYNFELKDEIAHRYTVWEISSVNLTAPVDKQSLEGRNVDISNVLQDALRTICIHNKPGDVSLSFNF